MGARAPPRRQASVLRPTPAIVRGRPLTTRSLINSLTTRPPSRDSSALLIPEREGGGGGRGGDQRARAGSTPDGRESGGKRDERFKANFITRPGAPH